MLLIWREVEVKPLGPVQLHDPPLTGCGPRSTAVLVEDTVTVFSSVQLPPPFTEIKGVIGVLEPTVMVNAWVLLSPQLLV
jgi:hypothetical protein